MKIRINWKKILLVVVDLILAVYLGLAFTSFNKPDETTKVCNKVVINIADETANGFIDAKEIKKRLEGQKLYPLGERMSYIDARKIEETLKKSAFVNTAECFKTQDGHVNITITQRMPIVRIKAHNGDDYYLDDKDCIMPNSHYTSDLIICTGHITKAFATDYLAPLSKAIMAEKLWESQIVQVNVLNDHGIELIPRVGDHIVYIGKLPSGKSKDDREQLIGEYLNKKLNQLMLFYKYGLSQAGWNKYAYINLEYDNQVICKRQDEAKVLENAPEEAPAAEPQQQQEPAQAPALTE